jgi:hypothetical protein
LRFALHLLLKSEIHCSITLPWAVDPEDRRLPVAQLKPDPSKVAAAPPAALDPAALAPDFADDAADPAADVAAAAADVVLAVLLSLPQALSVNAPTANRATSPDIRVIFTHSSIESNDFSRVRPPGSRGQPLLADNVGP